MRRGCVLGAVYCIYIHFYIYNNPTVSTPSFYNTAKDACWPAILSITHLPFAFTFITNFLKGGQWTLVATKCQCLAYEYLLISLQSLDVRFFHRH